MASFKPLMMGLAFAAIAGVPGLGITAWTGFSIGMTLGGLLFPEDLGTQERGRLNNIRLQGATQGTPIAKVFGVDRVAGNIIWTSSVREHVTTTDSGGGLSGTPSYSTKDYHYDIDIAVLVSEGVLTQYRRIWFNQDVILDSRSGSDAWDSKKVDSTKVYRYYGTNAQTANSVMQAALGAGNVPAYRDFAYVVFEKLNLDPYGGTPPNITFEVDAGTCNAQVISEWVCSQNGLASTDYDFTAVSGKTLRGFTLPSRTQGTNILDALAKTFFYDNVEVDGKIKASIRSGTSLGTITSGQLGGKLGTQPSGETVNISRIQESELPMRVVCTYTSELADFQVFSQEAFTQTRFSQNEETMSLPFVLTDDYARRVAFIQLYLTWLERNQFKLTTDWSALIWAPGDVITIPTPLGNVLVRITDMSMDVFGPLTMNMVREEPTIYTQVVTGAVPSNGNTTVSGDTLPTTYVADINAVNDADADYVGFYGAAASPNTSWVGGAVQVDSPGIVGYNNRLYVLSLNTPIFAFSSSAAVGQAITKLADGPTAKWDLTNTVDISLVRGTLTSVSQADVLNGANMIAIGSEIVSFTTATPLGTPGWYRLSGLIRGRRGTEYATNTHAIGDPVAIINTRGQRFNARMNQKGVSYTWRMYENGKTYSVLPSPTSTLLVGRSRMPYSPVLKTPVYQNGIGIVGDITFSWIRRARKQGEMQDNIDVPLDETIEKYDVEVYTDTTYGVLVRTYTGVTTTSKVYTAANQATDFGAGVKKTVGYIVYQYSDTLGARGFGAKGSAAVQT